MGGFLAIGNRGRGSRCVAQGSEKASEVEECCCLCLQAGSDTGMDGGFVVENIGP